MINVDKISLPYALKQVSCYIPQGKLVGIMGANGAGKSTLLKSIAGILPLVSGQILFGKQNLAQMTAKQKSEKLVYLAQNTPIFWDLSVYDVIALGLSQPLPSDLEEHKVRAVSTQFSITHLLNQPFQQLSGGEKARVQLARCCIKETPLLLADEPIATLDPYYQIDIMEQLKSLTPHRTCLVVIHQLSLAYKYCDEIILLDKGNLLASGNTDQVLTAENLAKSFSIHAEIHPSKREITHIRKISSP